MKWRYVTVDVFTGQQFGGNPLAVFTDAGGLTDAQMQSLAFELNLSETTFVLPPVDPAKSARVRIFNRTAEMAFAGHPSIGTAYVLACANHPHGDRLKLEVPAGIVDVEIERTDGVPVGGKIIAPQALSLGRTFPRKIIAACLGITSDDIITATHAPMLASVGNPYIIAELIPQALERCSPDLNGSKPPTTAAPIFASASRSTFTHAMAPMSARECSRRFPAPMKIPRLAVPLHRSPDYCSITATATNSPSSFVRANI